MSTWFKLPVCCMPSEIGGWMEHVNFGVKGLSSHHCEAVEDAINNHDKLVEENAKLREALEMSNEAFRDNLSKFAYKNESIMLECYTRNSALLNQLKEQNNDK